MPDLWRRLRSRELGVKNTHLQFFYTLTNHSFNPVPIQAPYVWYPSRSIGYGVGVRAKQTVTGFLNEACGVRVELKVLPPERCSGQRGRDLWGFALTVSADVTKCGSGVKRRKSDLPNLASPLLPLWEFWAGARNERRPRMGSLCEQRGRHVTHSSCRPCRHPLALSFGRFKEPPCRFKICPPATPSFRVKIKSYYLSMMSFAVRGQSARFRWAHPPVASSPPGTQPSSSTEKRYALPPVLLCSQVIDKLV